MSKDKIIVALDVSKEIQAREIISQLRYKVGGFKIGLQLFTAIGGSFVRELSESGVKIFLDLKYHDIPTTVAQAAVEAARLGVWMFNIHTLGGREMMLRTVDRVREVCEKERILQPKVLGVTVLTSSNDTTLQEVGIVQNTQDEVIRLARLASSCGLDGVVASAQEIKLIRKEIENQRFLIVTPGIRSTNAAHRLEDADDQKRTMSAGEAIESGADFLVIGRPITASRNMIHAIKHILNDVDAPVEESSKVKVLEFSKVN